MKLDWPHIALFAIIVTADIICMYLKLIPETAGISVLTGLLGVMVPTSYNSTINLSSGSSTTSLTTQPGSGQATLTQTSESESAPSEETN